MPKSVLYSFTITLLPKYYKHSPEIQYDISVAHIVGTLRALSSSIDLIAELTPKNLNIHYHGKIQFADIKTDCRKRFIDAFRGHKYAGFVSIDQITDEPGWNEYILKETQTTRQMIGRPPIILHDFIDFICLNVHRLYSFDYYTDNGDN